MNRSGLYWQIALTVFLFRPFEGFAGTDSISSVKCRERAPEVLDRFLAQFTTNFNYCKVSEECVWEEGGSGIHLNRDKYFDLKSCFEYADSMAQDICLYGRGKGHGMGSGFGVWLNRGKVPESYTCEHNKCIPHYKTFESTQLTSPNPKWKRNQPVAKKEDSDLAKSKVCHERIDKELPDLLLGNSHE